MISFVRVFESIPEQHRFIEPTIENVVCGGGAAAQREKRLLERARVIKLYTRLREWGNWSIEMAKAMGFSSNKSSMWSKKLSFIRVNKISIYSLKLKT